MDYEIVGRQLLRIRLDDGDKIYADPGELVAKSANVSMSPRLEGGILDSFQRKMSGGNMLPTEFEVKKSLEPGYVMLCGDPPGVVKALKLEEGESFIVEHFAFLAAQSSLGFSMKLTGVKAVAFGVTSNLLLEKFTGPGYLFIKALGDLMEQALDNTAEYDVEEGHIAGFDSSLKFSIKFVNASTAMFGGIGLTLARFSGNGRIIMHGISKSEYTKYKSKEAKQKKSE